MKRVMITTAIATTATVAAWVLIRGELSFGGELLIPAILTMWAIRREERRDEKESW